jgi:undecaprenyl-diphosphatase
VSSEVDEEPVARSAVGLLAVIGAGTAFGVLLLLVRVKWRPLLTLDLETAEELNEEVSRHHALVVLLRAVTNLGGPLFVTALVTVTVVVLLWRRRYREATFLAVAGIGGLILSPTLKLLVGRLRPVVEVPLQTATGNSFPSGHALGATIAYGSLLLVFLPSRFRAGTIGLVAVLIAAIAFTRVALGVHYVSDVVGGVLLGAAWVGVVAFSFRDLGRSRLK